MAMLADELVVLYASGRLDGLYAYAGFERKARPIKL